MGIALCDALFCYVGQGVQWAGFIVKHNCVFVGCNSNNKRCTVHAFKKISQDIKKISQDIKKISQDIEKISQDIKKISQDIKKISQDIKKISHDINP